MLGMTLAVPLATGTVTCNRIKDDGYGAEYLYKGTLSEVRVKTRHSTTVKSGVTYDRHNMEIVETVYATDTEAEFIRKAYFVIDQLPNDNDVEVPDAMADMIIDTSNALLTELYGWQS
jgi:hypothetical protein